MAISILTLLISSTIPSTNSQWISPSIPKMPAKHYHQSIGYYQDTIYLIGGSSNPRSLTQYHLNNDTFSYNAQFFPKSLQSQSQWSIQINNVIYMTGDFSAHMINTFDLKTKQFNYQTQHKHIMEELFHV